MSLPIRWMSAGQNFSKSRHVVRIARAGDVIGQRIDPDIHHMIGRSRHRHAPVEAGAADREVDQPALDEAQDLVAARFRADEVRVGGVEIEQGLLVFGEAEEPGLLGGPFDRRALRRELVAPLPVGQFLLLVEGLVADRIPAFVAVEIQVAGVRHRLPDRLAGGVMLGLDGADETIVRNIEYVGHFMEIAGHFVSKFARVRRRGHARSGPS